MFKSKKSRTEKTKFKAVFQLSFQATQVPQLKRSSGLTLSLVPEYVGKPTVRLPKSAVHEGTCTWENPVYETVKLVRERSTGKIGEKVYYFSVSSGSSKAGLLGEVSIDFAEYVEATTPWLVPLPLTGTESGPILNVTVQRMPGEDEERLVFQEDDISRKLDSVDRSFENPAKEDVSLKLDSLDRQFENNVRESNARGSNGDNEKMGYQNGKHSGSSDGTSCLKVSEQVSPSQLERKSSIPQRPVMNLKSTTRLAHQSSATDWSIDSFSDPNMSDSINSPEYNYTNEGQEERLSSFSDRLKSESVTMTRQVELLELELQSLRRQVVKETKKGQELSSKIGKLKEERDAFQCECEKLKSSHKVTDIRSDEVSDSSVEELKKELNREKYASKKLRSQLHRAQDSNSELVLVVRDLKKKLDEKNSGLSHLSSMKKTLNSTDTDEDLETSEELLKSEHAKEMAVLNQKVEELYVEITTLCKEKEEVENDVKRLSMENRTLRKENRDISSNLEQQRMRQLKMENESAESSTVIDDLASQVEMLKNENKKQFQALSQSWNTITELEAQVRSLEQELDTQNAGYEEELEAMIRNKALQEQRAMKAEETLRKIKQNNALTAEKLQEEFRTLSVEMTLKFDESEKLATKSRTEVNELNMQKRMTEEKLQKTNQELNLVRNQYQEQLLELRNQIGAKNQQIEKVSSELRNKLVENENAAKLSEERQEAFSMQISMLKGDIERLTRENNNFSEQVRQMRILKDEMEQMKRTTSDSEVLIRKCNEERHQLQERYALAKEEAEKCQEQLNAVSRLKDQQKKTMGNLLSEAEKLRAEYEDLKSSLNKEKSDKQDLLKKINKLKDSLQMKEESNLTMEQQLKESRIRNSDSATANVPSKNNRSIPNPQASQEVASLKKKVKNLEEQIKVKDTIMGNTTSSYQEKEKHLRSKIEELEGKTRKPQPSVKDLKGTGSVAMNDVSSTLSSIKAKGLGTQPINSDDSILAEMRAEMSLLKEKNKSMESELNDMEERYSEISLKFAEVEGERQQLVMTVRNLKNGKRI